MKKKKYLIFFKLNSFLKLVLNILNSKNTFFYRKNSPKKKIKKNNYALKFNFFIIFNKISIFIRKACLYIKNIIKRKFY